MAFRVPSSDEDVGDDDDDNDDGDDHGGDDEDEFFYDDEDMDEDDDVDSINPEDRESEIDDTEFEIEMAAADNEYARLPLAERAWQLVAAHKVAISEMVEVTKEVCSNIICATGPLMLT